MVVPTFAMAGAFARPSRPGPASFVRPPRPAFLGQTFDGILGMPPWLGDVIRLLVHGTTAWLGIYVGLAAAGVMSFLGWLVGLASAVGAVCDVASLAGRAFCGTD